MHIGPGGGFMGIAMTNTERTSTVTLFLPAGGETGFEGIRSPKDVRGFFHQDCPDSLALVADFEHDWTHHPESPLSTLYLDRWHHRDTAVLIGTDPEKHPAESERQPCRKGLAQTVSLDSVASRREL